VLCTIPLSALGAPSGFSSSQVNHGNGMSERDNFLLAQGTPTIVLSLL